MRKAVLVLCILWPAVAGAGWDEARAAYKQGDFKTAAKEMTVLAKGGDAKAQVNLGSMYAEGQGVRKDFKQAAAWYLKAADQGDAKAQVSLAELYMNGKGVRKDYVQALKWSILAAAAGDPDATKYRDDLATQIDSKQVDEAKRLARAWMAKHAPPKGAR